MTPASEIDPLDLLAEDFVARLRRGERPAIEEYASRQPDLAGRIREVFPALAAMEGVAEVLTSAGVASASTEVESRSRPEWIGDYRIVREVGRGGMGVVYEAEDVKLGRHVALKVLLPEFQSRGRFLERFRREARAAGRLHHTNIVPVFGVGEVDGTHYFVMQFIAGVGLDQVIRDVRRLRRQADRPADPIPPTADETLSASVANGLLAGPPVQSMDPVVPAESSVQTDRSHLAREGGYFQATARLALQAARALDHAHGLGVVHRDVKPSNMLLDLQGNLWVTDFGLAKTEEASDLTGSHDILGTLRYMAPERFTGGAIDSRADVYALGLTLYELLTLRPAFEEFDRFRLIQQIGHGRFTRPREFDPHIPRDLETIVLKAAALDPKDRYRTAGALADDLDLFLANRPIKSRRASNWEHLRRWARRNPVVAGLIGMVAALLVAITVLTLVNNARLGRTNKDLDTKRLELGQSLTEQGALRVQAQDEAWHAFVEATRAGRFSGHPGQRFEGRKNLQKAMELAPGRDLLTIRNEAVGCLVLPDVEPVIDLPWPEGTNKVTFTRDLSRYARVDRSNRITIRRVADDGECFELPHPGKPIPYHGAEFSPDGKYFVHWTESRFRIWRVDGQQPKEALSVDQDLPARLAKNAPVKLTGYNFLADGNRLAVIDSEGGLRVFDLSDADLARRTRPTAEVRFPADRRNFVWAHPTRPDQFLITSSKRIVLYDLERRTSIHSQPNPDGVGASWVAWHPEGIVYAIAGNDTLRRIFVCAADTGVVQSTLSGHANNGLLVAFDPAGDHLWSTDWDNQTRLWDWRAGRTIFECEAAVAIPPVVAPDGSLAGVNRGDRVQVWRVAGGRETVRIPVPANMPVGKSAIVGPEVLSPDGRLLAAPCEDLIALYDLQSRELAGSIAMRHARPVRFDADGTGLLVKWNPIGIPGLFRIPVTRTESRVKVGEPKLAMALADCWDEFGFSDDDRLLAVPLKNHRSRLYRGMDQRPLDLGSQSNVRFCSVSPDGKWVVTGSHGEGFVALWDAVTGKQKKLLEAWGGQSAFSRDGRWACTFRSDTRVCRIWDTTTWESGAAFAGERGVFSPDGSLLAVSGGAGVVRLVRVPSGEEVVKLSVPDNVHFVPTCFTPDGGTFVARAIGSGFVQTWDLHAIRRQLRPMGLDWDETPLPDAPQEPYRYPARLVVSGPLPPPVSLPTLPSPPVRPPAAMNDPLVRWAVHSLVIAQEPFHPAGYLRRAEALTAMNRFDEAIEDATTAIERDPDRAEGFLVRGRVRRTAGDLRRALTDFERAVKLAPNSGPAHADRANAAQRLRDDPSLLDSAQRLTELNPTNGGWWVTLAAVRLVGERSVRDLPAALAAAEKAVQLNGTNPYYQTVLGHALLESGQTAAAEKHFTESRRLKPPAVYDAINLLGLALCVHQAGDDARVRGWFAQAIAVKDAGRFGSELAERLFQRVYAEAAKALASQPAWK
jgi:eukaryotic-like serine/threonine-protein kinase